MDNTTCRSSEGSRSPSLNQVMAGVGYPSARHGSEAVLPSKTSVRGAGFKLNAGVAVNEMEQ